MKDAESGDALGVYNRYFLYKDKLEKDHYVLGDSIADAIRALVPTVASYNEKVKAEKERVATEAQNKADIVAIQASIDEQKKALEDIKTAIAATEKPSYGDQKDYVANTVAGELATAESTLKGLEIMLEDLMENEDVTSGATAVDKKAFDESIADFKTTLGALSDSVNAAATDLKAWADFQALSQNLLSTYNNGLKSLRALKSVNENYTVVETRAKAVEDELTELYNTAAKAFTIKADDPTGAAAALTTDSAIADKAIQNIKTQVEMFEELVNGNEELGLEGQNPLMEKYLGTLADFNKTYQEVKATMEGLESSAGLNEFQKQIDAVYQKAVLFKDAIDADYNKLELASDGTIETLDGATFDAVNDEIAAEIENIKALLQPIVDLQAALDQAKTDIEKLAEKYVEEENQATMVSKFDESVKNLQDAINDLTIPVSDEKKAEVAEAITNLTDQAEILFSTYAKVQNLISDFATTVANLETIINDKKILSGKEEFIANFRANNEAYKAVLAKLNGTADEKGEKQLFAEALAANGQECLNLFTALLDTCVNYDYITAINDVARDYEIAGSQHNLDVLVPLKNEADKVYKEAEKYAGFEELTKLLNTATNARYKASEDFKKAQADEYAPEAFKAVDEKCKEAFDAYNQLIEDAAKYKSYFEYYNEDKTRLDALQKDLTDYMHEWRNSLDGDVLFVWEENQDKLNDLIDAAQAQMLKTYMEDYASEATGYGSAMIRMVYDKQIDAIAHAIDMLKKNIETNAANYVALQGSASTVRTLINNTIALIEKAKENQLGETAPDGDRYIDQCLEILDQLLVGAYETEDGKTLANLADLTAKVGEEYSDGQLAVATNYRELEDAFDALAKVAQNISQQFSDTLDNIIVSYNTENFTKAYENALSLADTQYQIAVQVYNNYMYGLDNERYLTFEYNGKTIKQIIGDHGYIYEYIDKIKALGEEMANYLAVMNGTKELKDGKYVDADNDPVAITPEESAAKVQEITDLENEIIAALTAMQKDGAEFARAFAAATEAEANQFIADAQKKMTDAGISADSDAYKLATTYNKTQLKEAVKQFTEASEKYDKEVAEGGIGNLGIETDRIADVYDAAFKAINFDWAADSYWYGDKRKAALEELAGYEEIVKAAEFAPAEEKAEFEAVRDEIKAMFDEQATIETLPELIKKLEAALDKAEKLAKKIEQISDKASAEKEAFDNWTGTVNTDNANLDKLIEFVNSLAAGDLAVVKPAKDALATLNNGVVTNKGNLVANDAWLKGLQAKFEAALHNAYATAATAETNELKEWAYKLQVAYNDANVNSTTLTAEEKEALKARVDAVAKSIPVWTVAAGSELKALEEFAGKFSGECVELESEIADLYKTLQGSWTEDKNGNDNPVTDPVAAANAEVEEAANAATAVLTEGQTTLEGAYESVQKEFADKYAAYAEELAAINAAVEGEGDDIVLSAEKYINKYNKLAETVEATNAKLKKAQEDAAAVEAAKAANAEAAARLNEELAQKQAELDALNADLEAYGEEVAALYKAQTTWIQSQIDAAAAAIEKAEEAVKLGEESKLDEFLKTDEFEAWINNIHLLGAKANATNYEPALLNKQYETKKALGELKVVPEILEKVIEPEMKAQAKAIAAFQDALAEAKTVEDYDKLSEDAKAIIAAYDAILAEAGEYVFVLGDVNLDPDGAVNVQDVQTLITWVGEGVTYEDLYAANPVQAAAADVLGDKMINISDVTAEIDLVFNTATQNAMRITSRSMVANAGSIGAVLLGTEGDVSTYAVMLNSTVDFVAGQFDINVADGSEIVDARMSGNSHDLYRFDNSDATRFIVASMDNASIDMVGGNLLIIEVRGTAAPVVEGAIFTDASARGYKLNAAGTSGIDGVDVENGTMTQRIYNAAGQAMRAIQRGINIIRHSDGTTTKELHK